MTNAGGRWVRVGGRFERGDSVTTWSVAEGRRGRRWRTISLDRSGSMRAMLLEVGPDGRPTRLELATPRGLLTMHPDGQSPRMHGNLVSERGVRPINLPCGPDHLVAVDGEPLAVVAAIPGLRAEAGERLERPILVVDRSLAVIGQTWRVERVDSATWQLDPLDGSPGGVRVEIDALGLPRAIDGVAVNAVRWSLED